MLILKQTKDLRQYIKSGIAQTESLGFVPTMGALHEGHISLIKIAKELCSTVVASIFVNPTQFNDPKDFKLYPKTIEADIYMLEKAGCDILFLPDVEEIYPGGIPTNEHYNIGYLETVLDGKYRPGHFQGVCQVVNRLMNIVEPNKLFLGQKDYQQCMVIKKLLSITGSKAEIVVCPTLRELDGLAMSSRNRRLNPEERQNATGIYQALLYIAEHIKTAPWLEVKKGAHNILKDYKLKPDYIELADADNLELLESAANTTIVVALIAAFMGEVRLIDNMIITT